MVIFTQASQCLFQHGEGKSFTVHMYNNIIADRHVYCCVRWNGSVDKLLVMQAEIVWLEGNREITHLSVVLGYIHYCSGTSVTQSDNVRLCLEPEVYSESSISHVAVQD